jgi:hypothetical protein
MTEEEVASDDSLSSSAGGIEPPASATGPPTGGAAKSLSHSAPKRSKIAQLEGRGEVKELLHDLIEAMDRRAALSLARELGQLPQVWEIKWDELNGPERRRLVEEDGLNAVMTLEDYGFIHAAGGPKEWCWYWIWDPKAREYDLNHRAAFAALLVMAAELKEAEKRSASDLARAMEDVNHKWGYYKPLKSILEHQQSEHDVWGKRGKPNKEALPNWEENLKALEDT